MINFSLWKERDFKFALQSQPSPNMEPAPILRLTKHKSLNIVPYFSLWKEHGSMCALQSRPSLGCALGQIWGMTPYCDFVSDRQATSGPFSFAPSPPFLSKLTEINRVIVELLLCHLHLERLILLLNHLGRFVATFS